MTAELLILTGKEIEYCLKKCRLAAKAASGTDIGAQIDVMCSNLEKGIDIKGSHVRTFKDNEKNVLACGITIYELLIRDKQDILRSHFNILDMQLSVDDIQTGVNEICAYAEQEKIDVAALKKKIKFRKKTPVRKLYISDLHFFHDGINHRMDKRGFSGYEEMNEYMIRQWNQNVTSKDEVYILGDFSIARGSATNEILRRLNGKKYLVEGNHDTYLRDKDFDSSLFQWIRPYAEIMDSTRRVILSHYPVFCYKGQYRIRKDGSPLTYMLYGHVHNTHDELLVNEFINITKNTKVLSKYHPEGNLIPCNMINCFCMFSEYIPMTLDEWKRLDAKRRSVLTEKDNCC